MKTKIKLAGLAIMYCGALCFSGQSCSDARRGYMALPPTTQVMVEKVHALERTVRATEWDLTTDERIYALKHADIVQRRYVALQRTLAIARSELQSLSAIPEVLEGCAMKEAWETKQSLFDLLMAPVIGTALTAALLAPIAYRIKKDARHPDVLHTP